MNNLPCAAEIRLLHNQARAAELLAQWDQRLPDQIRDAIKLDEKALILLDASSAREADLGYLSLAVDILRQTLVKKDYEIKEKSWRIQVQADGTLGDYHYQAIISWK
jgi:hypothetical protein